MSVDKNYTAPGLTNSAALRIELLADEAILLAGVVIEQVWTIAGTSTVVVRADVDPGIADVEIQAVINAHDPDADYSVPIADQQGAEFPYLGAFVSAADLPEPTAAGAVAVAGGANGRQIYARAGGLWVLIGTLTTASLAAALSTAQCGGDPSDSAPPYSSVRGFVFDTIYLRSVAGFSDWNRYALAGRLENPGDRVDFPGWAAQPEGGQLGLVFLPAGTVPAPATSTTITGAWSGQWTGGASFVLAGSTWKLRGSGSQGSGFGSNKPSINAGEQLLVAVQSNGKVEIRNENSARESSFTVPVGGLDLWVVAQSVDQRWAPAFATSPALPTPGSPDPDGATRYTPTHAVQLDGVNDRVEVPNGATLGNVLRWDSDWSIACRLPSDDINTSYFESMFGRGSWNAIGLNSDSGTLRVHAQRQSSGLYYGSSSTLPGPTDLAGEWVLFEYDSSAQELRTYVDDNLAHTLSVSSIAASVNVTSADLLVGSMATSSSGSYGYAWAGQLHEVFWLDRVMTADERADVVRDGNLANHSWYGDVLAWLPLGTGDTYPTMRNLVAGADDGELINATADSIVEI